jgi:branched-chain amino acid transport system ATP-binding protein
MARTFQRIELFSTLSVRDNIVVAAEASKGRGARSVDDLVARLGLGEVADTRAGELPTGTARLVEVARALATGPRILLLDEPASGLDDQESQDFGHLLRELAADGLAVVLVEHDVGLVMRVCDDVYVLDLGLIIAHGAPHAVQNDEAVLRAYLGAA